MRGNPGWRKQKMVLCSYKLKNSRGCQTSTLNREEARMGLKGSWSSFTDVQISQPSSLQTSEPINLYRLKLHNLSHSVTQSWKRSRHPSLLPPPLLNKTFTETNECTRRGFHSSFQNSLSYILHDSERVMWVP